MTLGFYIALMFAGGCGVLLRYSAGRALAQVQWLGVPIGTMVVNTLGCFLMGYFAAWFVQREEFSIATQTVILTGFLGGFTTFSAFSFETVGLLENAAVFRAFTYAVLQLIICIALCFFGMWLARH